MKDLINRIRAIAKLIMKLISDRTVMSPAKNENKEKGEQTFCAEFVKF